MKRFKYTKKHLEFLKVGYLSMNVRDLTKAFNKHFGLNKGEGSIKAALQNHKIRCGRTPKDRLVNRFRLFTDEQVKFLENNFKGITAIEMTKIFNDHFDTNITLQQIKSAVHNRGINSGRTGHFPKGHKPWNYGTKGQGLTGANKGSFKKGSMPANRRPLGSERICSKDGYVYIKVAEKDPYTGFPTRYKLKHVHIWEQKNGSVPKGMCLIFKDSNKLNCKLNNLMLMSRAELLRLNQHGYKDAPAEVKATILAMVKLEVTTFKKMKRKGNAKK